MWCFISGVVTYLAALIHAWSFWYFALGSLLLYMFDLFAHAHALAHALAHTHRTHTHTHSHVHAHAHTHTHHTYTNV